jgi:hypothetical protein
MRKRQLIELLEKISGNPEVVLWEGFVGDYMHIDKDITVHELVKRSRDLIGLRCKSKEEIEQAFRNQDWDFPNPNIETIEEYNKWYGQHKKKVILISPKPRGKSTFDRLGNISY